MKKIKTTFIVAVIFFITTMPFRELFNVIEVTEMRPASALPPVLGLMLGVPGVLGCAIGNLFADMLSGYGFTLSAWGFIAQFIFGLLPFLAWNIISRKGKTDKKGVVVFRLNSTKNVICYIFIILTNSMIMAAMLGGLMHFHGISTFFSDATLMVFLNNFVFGVVLGIPIIIFITVKRFKSDNAILSLNERLVLIFLSLGVISAMLIGFFAYLELSQIIDNHLAMWNRIYTYITLNIFIFNLITIAYIRYSEKSITTPIEAVSKIAQNYITQGGNHLNCNITDKCYEFSKIKNEIGVLVAAFLAMSEKIAEHTEHLEKVNRAYYRFLPSEILQQLGKESVVAVNRGDNTAIDTHILYVSLIGFAKAVDSKCAESAFELFNRIGGTIMEIVIENGGVVESGSQTGFICFFESREKAFEAAFSIRHELRVYESSRGSASIKTAVSLVEGSVLIGVAGHEKRLCTFSISPSVALAEYLTEIATLYGAGVICTDSSRKNKRLLGDFLLSNNETIRLYDYYEGEEEEVFFERNKLRTLFEKGVKHFENKQFKKAKAVFIEYLKQSVPDAAAKQYLFLCDHNIKNLSS